MSCVPPQFRNTPSFCFYEVRCVRVTVTHAGRVCPQLELEEQRSGLARSLPAFPPCVFFAGRKLPGCSTRLLSDWSEEDVQAWLSQEGLQDLVSTFSTHNIDGAELSRLSKETAAELGIGEAKNTPRSHARELTLAGTRHFPFVRISCSIPKPNLQAPIEKHDVSSFFFFPSDALI